jgi:poly(hydroxyalkanoate) depolymerase family esterase
MHHRSGFAHVSWRTCRSFIKLLAVALLAVGVGDVLRAPPAAAAPKPKCSYTHLTELKSFGDNPGHLNGYSYTPADLPAGAPLVVALHGCGQTACDYDDETGWTALADKLKFALLFPEQQGLTFHPDGYGGNPAKCFSWWDTSQTREFGEPKSIIGMVKWMVDTYGLDPHRIYVTGLSAGAGMTDVMLANFPDCFAGGAPIAGPPFGCAEGVVNHAIGMECMCMNGTPGYPYCANMQDPLAVTAEERGDAVRKRTCGPLSEHSGALCPETAAAGKWPRISVWQGSHDPMVAPVNLTRQMQQWTNLHRIDPASGVTVQEPSAAPYDIQHTTWADANGAVQVETYLIKSALPLEQTPGTGHATAVYPEQACGCTSVDCACERNPQGACEPASRTGYIKDAHVCSSLRIAQFWGLDKPAGPPSAVPVCAPLR